MRENLKCNMCDQKANELITNEYKYFYPNTILLGQNTPICAIFLITKPEFIIGYSTDCDAVLHFSREISRHHACISWTNDSYEIKDLGSTNHTFLNGTELIPETKYKVNPGDHIAFASFTFEIIAINL